MTSIFIWQVVPTPACLKIRQNRLQNAGCSGQSTCQMKMDVTLGPVPHRRAGADGRTPDHGVRSRQSTGPPASQGLLGERSAGRTLAGKSSIPLEYLSRRNPSPSVLSPRVPNSRASPRRLALHSRDRHGEAPRGPGRQRHCTRRVSPVPRSPRHTRRAVGVRVPQPEIQPSGTGEPVESGHRPDAGSTGGRDTHFIEEPHHGPRRPRGQVRVCHVAPRR